MLSRFGLAVVLAISAGAAQAQSVADIGGPAELPPASFTGQQYVDSRGCVFLRAGIGGRVTWAPRLDRNRQVQCGFPPTFGSRPPAAAVAAAEPEPVPTTPAPAAEPAPAPVVRAAPVAPAPVRVTAPPPPVAAPAPPPVAVAQTGTTGRRIGCFTNTPVPVRLYLRYGGSVVLCTRGDGTLEGARAPIYPPGSGVGASLTGPQLAAVRGTAQATQAATASFDPPPGYRAAWEDDRLNPNRAQGTAEGQAQQDQIWTREVPARLVVETATPAPVVSRSTKTDATAPVAAPQATGSFYVQVGTFGVPDNAAGASGRLQALGLPTARSNITQGGRALTVVLAGPFGTSGAAQAALNAARGVGFGDAFIR
jgi:cell division septation protein DedD